jgi:hypothetical protein
MAIYSKEFTPVADLKRKRELESRRKARLAPKKPPSGVLEAGAGLAARGNLPGAAAVRNKALRDWQTQEGRRLADVESQLYKEESDTRQAGLSIAADMQKQRMADEQQTGLARFQAGEQAKLQGERLAAQEKLARQKLPGQKGGLTPKQIADLETGFREEYYGKGDRGRELQGKYGTRTEGGLFGIGGEEVSGGGVDAYVRDMMHRYQQPDAQAAQGMPQAKQPALPSYGSITSGGEVVARQGAVPRGGIDTEGYAASLRGGLPQAPRQIEQPTGRIQASLPQVAGLEQLGVEIPEEFTEAERIPGVSRELPQRTKRLLAGLGGLKGQLTSPVDLQKQRPLSRQQRMARRSFIRPRPY